MPGPGQIAGSYYLGGWHGSDSSSMGSLPVRNPATAKRIGYCPIFNHAAIVPEIYKAAHDAQQFWYHEVTMDEKEAFFAKAVELFKEHRGELVWTMIKESGKLWKWADAEVTEAIETFRHFYGEVSRVHSPKGVERGRTPKRSVRSYRKPKGVALLLAPWNFLFNIPIAWKTAAALAGGNAVVLKPAEQTPFTAEFGVGLLQEALRDVLGVERYRYVKNLIQLIQGDGTTGALLVNSDLYNVVSFTGGEVAGRSVASAAGQNLRQSYLELGGHAGMAVLSDFDLSRAISEAIRGCNGDSGQRCVSTRKIAIDQARFKLGVKLYIKEAQKLRIGRPDDPQSYMGPLISEEQLEKVNSAVRSTIHAGARCLLGGYPLMAETLSRARLEGLNVNEAAIKVGGYYYPPTILVGVDYGMPAMDAEIFGPVICMLPLGGKMLREQFEHGVKFLNKARQGLSNAILTNNAVLIEEAPFRIDTGILYGRRGTTGAETGQKFGGVKNSGWGSEGEGIEDFTDPMTYYIDLSDEVRMAQAGDDEKIWEVLKKSKSPYFD